MIMDTGILQDQLQKLGTYLCTYLGFRVFASLEPQLDVKKATRQYHGQRSLEFSVRH